MKALQDKQIDQRIKDLLKQDKMQLVDEKNQPVYGKQLHIMVDFDEDDDVSPSKYPADEEDETSMSPDIKTKKLVRFFSLFSV